MFLCQENKDPWLPEGTCPCVLLLSFVALRLCLPQTTLAHASRSALGLSLIPQHLFLYLRPPPPSHKTRSNPTSPSVTPSHILCLCASRGSSLWDIFSAEHHLWAPPPFFFLFRHLRHQRQVFLQVLFLPPFISKGWITQRSRGFE